MEVKEILEEEQQKKESNNLAVKQVKISTSHLSVTDESGFGEDISACSIEDKTFDENIGEDNSMDTSERRNHLIDDKLKTDIDNGFLSIRKDDSGILSDKSPSVGTNKESNDGDFSESISESFDDTNMIELSETVNDHEKDCELTKDNNIVTDQDHKIDDGRSNKDLLAKENNVTESIPVLDDINSAADKNNHDDVTVSFTSETVGTVNPGASPNKQEESEKCDDTNDDDDFAEFVRKTVKSHSHVKKLVDYDTNTDSDSHDSRSDSPVMKKGHRQYRKRKPDSDSDEVNSTSDKVSESTSNGQTDGTPVLLKHSELNENESRNNVDISDLSSDSTDESDSSPKPKRRDSSSASESGDGPPDISEFGPPKHKWRALFDLRQREFGYSNTDDPYFFRKQVQGSLQMVQRFKLQYKMEKHEGCVNALHFNRIGTLLASGSDDLNIVIWNWLRNRPALVYDSGHRSNVFQAKFMPNSGDCHVVSCARDGQVRLADLSSTGVCKGTKKIAQHRGAAHKLALEVDSPHVVMSAGEDAVTFEIDLRQDKPNKLVTTKEDDKKVAIYSIHSNPMKSSEFCLGGRDHFIRVYDKRKISEAVNDGLLKKYAPHHIAKAEGNNMKANVTCACYNYNGSEILGTYNDEDIYLFSNEHSDSANYIHRYCGHRNNQTVKGVNFYGPHSEFIVSGSDCGHIFLWDKATENIVQYMEGDEGGVINVLEPHPFAPVLATSGLDHDVKIWAPTADSPTELKGLKKLMKRNSREREDERQNDGGMIDGSMLWFIMHHLRRGRRQRAREARAARGEPAPEEESSDTLSDEDMTTDEDSDEESPRDAITCNPS